MYLITQRDRSGSPARYSCSIEMMQKRIQITAVYPIAASDLGRNLIAALGNVRPDGLPGSNRQTVVLQ